ncbi:protein odr-4 homolog isoform X2 [Cimex lectularius]|uniref:Uncharacterized protein n=1 Tax=Cimex lectularius TaxID=79782 RepID=A0A8I6S543_CIMLE|nr:protein odr-4 homolog isoform X2 [Cimex lectularius]
MVKSLPVYADEKLLAHLTNISCVEGGVTSGLIVGQRTPKKDIVVHLTVTPVPEENGRPIKTEVTNGKPLELRCVSEILELDDTWFTFHTENVSRMLPGGMWILGLYFSSPENIFNNEKTLNKVRSIMSFINKSTARNECLFGDPPGNYKLVFHYNSKSKQFACKSIDSSMAFANADWKFQNSQFVWHKVESSYSLNRFEPYEIVDETPKPVIVYLKDKLQKIRKEIDATICTVNGVFRKNTDTLQDIKMLTDQQRKTKEKDDSFKVFMYSLTEPPEDMASKVVVQMTYGEMVFDGIIGSQVFLHENATVDETVLAVKQDILRSLASRLEMHWDSFDLTDENNKVHEPPRRILFKDKRSGLTFSDYIYKNETINDIASNLQLHLGILVPISDLIDCFERPYRKLKPKMDTGEQKANHLGTDKKSDNTNLILYGIMGAAVVLVISLFLHLFT